MADNSIPDFPINSKQIEIAGVPFEVVVYSAKCITLTSLKTGKTVQLHGQGALNVWVEQFRWYMAHKQAMAALEAA